MENLGLTVKYYPLHPKPTKAKGHFVRSGRTYDTDKWTRRPLSVSWEQPPRAPKYSNVIMWDAADSNNVYWAMYNLGRDGNPADGGVNIVNYTVPTGNANGGKREVVIGVFLSTRRWKADMSATDAIRKYRHKADAALMFKVISGKADKPAKAPRTPRKSSNKTAQKAPSTPRGTPRKLSAAQMSSAIAAASTVLSGTPKKSATPRKSASPKPKSPRAPSALQGTLIGGPTPTANDLKDKPDVKYRSAEHNEMRPVHQGRLYNVDRWTNGELHVKPAGDVDARYYHILMWNATTDDKDNRYLWAEYNIPVDGSGKGSVVVPYRKPDVAKGSQDSIMLAVLFSNRRWNKKTRPSALLASLPKNTYMQSMLFDAANGRPSKTVSW